MFYARVYTCRVNTIATILALAASLIVQSQTANNVVAQQDLTIATQLIQVVESNFAGQLDAPLQTASAAPVNVQSETQTVSSQGCVPNPQLAVTYGGTSVIQTTPTTFKLQVYPTIDYQTGCPLDSDTPFSITKQSDAQSSYLVTSGTVKDFNGAFIYNGNDWRYSPPDGIGILLSTATSTASLVVTVGDQTVTESL